MGIFEYMRDCGLCEDLTILSFYVKPCMTEKMYFFPPEATVQLLHRKVV